MEMIVHLHLRLVDKNTGRAPDPTGLSVALFDRDVIKDDFLGQSTPDASGNATFAFSRSDFRSLDSPLEQYPDLYFKVFRDEVCIYQSLVFEQSRPFDSDQFDMQGGLHYSLGTFLI